MTVYYNKCYNRVLNKKGGYPNSLFTKYEEHKYGRYFKTLDKYLNRKPCALDQCKRKKQEEFVDIPMKLTLVTVFP